MPAESLARDGWLRWMVRATWLVLAANLIAVYAMKLTHGQWPMSHPYSGLTMLLAVSVFGAMDWSIVRGRVSPRHAAAVQVSLSLGAVLILTAAFLMFIANRESL